VSGGEIRGPGWTAIDRALDPARIAAGEATPFPDTIFDNARGALIMTMTAARTERCPQVVPDRPDPVSRSVRFVAIHRTSGPISKDSNRLQALSKDTPVPGRSPVLPVSSRPSRSILKVGLLCLVACLAVAPAFAQENYAPPRITTDGEKDWNRKNIIAFQRAARSSAPNQAEKDVLISGAKTFVDRLTNPDNSSKLVTLADQLINTYIYGPTTTNGARAVLLAETVNHAKELLEEDPPHAPIVTINLVTLLSRLYARPANAAAGTAQVPYVAAQVPLRSVILSAKLHLHAKIPAARALGSIGQNAVQGVADGDLAITGRDAIVTDLVKALAAPDAQGLDAGPRWYREALVEAIGACDLPMSLAGSSAPIDAVVGRLTDPKEHLKVRAAAGRALSQMSLTSAINVQLLIHETAVVAAKLATDFNAKPANERSGGDKWTAAYVYFAFKPMTPAQAQKGWGYLNLSVRPGLGGAVPFATAANTAILPILKTFLNAPPNTLPASIAAADLTTAMTWITGNVPMNRKATAKSPAIPTPAARGEFPAPAAPPAAPAKGTAPVPMTQGSSTSAVMK
jgi:hypothetical protein